MAEGLFAELDAFSGDSGMDHTHMDDPASMKYEYGIDQPLPKKRKAAGAVPVTVQGTKRACAFCRELHKQCDDERPCKRCVSHGRAHLCYTPAPKPKRSNKMNALLNAPSGISPALSTIPSVPATPVAAAALASGSNLALDLAQQLEEQRKQQKLQQLQLELQIQQLQQQLLQQQQFIDAQQQPAVQVFKTEPQPPREFDSEMMLTQDTQFNPSSSMELFMRSAASAAAIDPPSSPSPSLSPSTDSDDLILHLDAHTQPHSAFYPPNDPILDPLLQYMQDQSPVGHPHELTADWRNMNHISQHDSSTSVVSPLTHSDNSMHIDVEEVPAVEQVGQQDDNLRISSFFAHSPSSSGTIPVSSVGQIMSQAPTWNHAALALMPIPVSEPVHPGCPTANNEGLKLDVDINRLAEAVDKLVICPEQQAARAAAAQALLQHGQPAPSSQLATTSHTSQKNTYEICQSKMHEMLWRLADKAGQNGDPSSELGGVFQKMLTVMMPTVSLFDVSRHQMDFGAIALRVKIALQMTSDLQQPAVICNAHALLFVNEKMHQMTGGVIAIRSRQTSARIYDFDLFHPDDAVRFFSRTLDLVADKRSVEDRPVFRIVSAASPLGYVTCIVNHSFLFEQMTAMPMFSLLTFTRIDDIQPAPTTSAPSAFAIAAS